MKKILSIVLPAYNVQKYIETCLETLVQQDIEKEEYEIIIVDDGSTDGTSDVVQNFIEGHDSYSISLIRKKNGGVSSARNFGLKKACGSYVWFIDPDDFVLPNSFGKIKRYLAEEKWNIIYLDAKTVEENTRPENINTQVDIEISTKKLLNYQHCGPWTRIVNRNFLLENEILFCEKLAYGEDFLWNHLILQNKEQLAQEYYIRGYIYYYRLRENSAYRKAKELRYTDNNHYRNLIYLAEEYQKLTKVPKYNNKKLNLVLRQAKEAAVFSLAFLPTTYFKQELEQMKKNGMYPYHIIKEDLKPSGSWKHTMVGWLMFLLPCETYAGILNHLLRRNFQEK